MTQIAAIGNLSVDVVAEQPPSPGGTVFFSARTLARLGAPARVTVSCASRDRPLFRALEELPQPPTWRESPETTAFRFRYTRGGRRVMRVEAVGASWSPQDALEAVGDADWVHVGALLRTDFRHATLEALASGRKLLVDGQGLLRTARIGPLRRDRRLGDVLQFVTMLKLDSGEAQLLVGDTEPERLAALGVPEVLLTLGAKGAVVVTRARIEGVPAHDVDEVGDPTGAGDTFSAAYLVARVAGAAPLEAARSASATAGEFLSRR